MVVVTLVSAAPMDSHLVKINLTVVQPDETTQREVLDIDDRSFAAIGVTYDQVSAGYAVKDKQGKVWSLVIMSTISINRYWRLMYYPFADFF